MYMLNASRSHQQREGLQARISLAGFSPPPPVCVPHQYFSNSSRATHRPTAPPFASAQSKSSLSACSFLLKLGGASQTQTPKNSWPKETSDFQQDSLHGAPNNTTHLFTPAPCLLHCFRHLLSNPIPSAGKTSNFSQTQSYLTGISKTYLFLRHSVPTDVVYKRFRRKNNNTLHGTGVSLFRCNAQKKKD